MVTGDISKLIPRTDTFQYALIARRTTPFNKHYLMGAYEICYSTNPIYDGLSSLKFTITHPSEEAETFHSQARSYIQSRVNGTQTFKTVLFSDISYGTFLYGRNVALSQKEKKLKDLVIIDRPFIGPIRTNDESVVLIVIAPNILGEDRWNKYLLNYCRYKYYNEIYLLTQGLKPTIEI